jgi:hypothetical protein
MKSFINKTKSISKGFLYNFRGWKTNRKIIVIESDDWGSERTPSVDVYNQLINKGLRVDLCPFSKFDTIESNRDLEELFNVLKSVKDKNGNSAIFTANFNLANPDFQKIREYDYKKYFYIDYSATLGKYNSQDVLEKIKKGIADKVFFPQNHSREHLSPQIWLSEINNNNRSLQKAFDLGVYAIGFVASPEIKKYHLASMLYSSQEEFLFIKESITDSVKLFEKNFDFFPQSFIAPVYTWNDDIEQLLFDQGIEVIQSSHFQNNFDPLNSDKLKRKYRFTGQKNSLNQLYTVRNCVFEPSIYRNIDNVSSCLKNIEFSFSMKKPAIISTHRLNYIGGLEVKNREDNLRKLKELLSKIVAIWPDVEFMSNSDLVSLIKNKV